MAGQVIIRSTCHRCACGDFSWLTICN